MPELVEKKKLKGTGLEKAVEALDDAFQALPREHRQALGMAIYRVWPSMRQYQTDVDAVLTKGIADAAFKLLLSLAFILPRGKEHTLTKLADALSSRAPNIQRFIKAVSAACSSSPAVLVGGESGEDDPQVLPAPAPQLPER